MQLKAKSLLISLLNSLPKMIRKWFATWRIDHGECSWMVLGANANIVIITSEGIRLEHSFKLGFKTSNNEAEYEAPIVGLKTAFDLGARDMEVYLDS